MRSSMIKLKKKFTQEEDLKLTEYVNTYGTSNWNVIAHHYGNRSARQLKDRWFNYLDPRVDLHEWTSEEEELLLEKLAQIGKKWRVIALFFKGRTDVHLKNRYKLMKRRERITGNIRLPNKQENREELQFNELSLTNQIDDNNLVTILPIENQNMDSWFSDDFF